MNSLFKFYNLINFSLLVSLCTLEFSWLNVYKKLIQNNKYFFQSQ